MQFIDHRARSMLASAVTAWLLVACGGGADEPPPPVPTRTAAASVESADSPPATDEVPTGAASPAPESYAGDREQALSTSCTPSYATPRVAAYDLTRDRSAARQALLAKFGVAVVNMPYTATATETNTFTAGIKAINPSIRIAQYINFPDLKGAPSTSDYDYRLAQEVGARGWWLRDATGARVSWTSGSTYGVNMTSWTPTNGAGQRYPQYKARYDHDAYLLGRTGIDYVFVANTWARPRVDADWRGTKTNQLRSDPTIQSAMRAGNAAYWQSLRSIAPAVRLVGGLDNTNDLSAPEYKGVLDGAYLDGMIGKSWSLETVRGWDAMMAHYRAVRANTRGDKLVLFSVHGESVSDYAAMRYGLASALLDDGHFMFRPNSGGAVPTWYDEYAAAIGAPVQAPPTSPASNGIWLRRFENGIVLVNPQGTSATIDVGSGYQRLAGKQDPVVNNGQVQSRVTLPGRSGLLMLKVPAPCAPTSFATPKVAAIDFTKDTTDANKAYLAKFNFALIGLSRSKGATVMNSFTSGIKALNPSVELAHYVVINEVKCSATTSDDYYDVWTAINKADWWLRDGSGARSQWTATYNACDINLTQWSPKNAAGKTWQQYKWQYDWDVFFKNMPKVDYVHMDNFFRKYRKDADFKRIGTNQPAADEYYAAAWRAGVMRYVETVRATQPQLKVSVNADSDLSQPEYKGKLDLAFLEGVIGKSWSTETRSWTLAMDYYRAALRNVRTPGKAILQAFTANNDYALARYGLASTMLDDGLFMQIDYPGSGGGLRSSRFDEYDAPIGAPIEPPPVAAAQNGVWMRRYQNGLVLVNPSKTTSATITVGPGYRRLVGTQDPVVNNGKAESTVALPPRSGLLMLKS